GAEGRGRRRKPSSSTIWPPVRSGGRAKVFWLGGVVDRARAEATNTARDEDSGGRPACAAHRLRSGPAAGETAERSGNPVPRASQTKTRSCGKYGRQEPRNWSERKSEEALSYGSWTSTVRRPSIVASPTTDTRPSAARTVIGTITSLGIAVC